MTLANLPYKAPFIQHFDVGLSHPKPLNPRSLGRKIPPRPRAGSEEAMRSLCRHVGRGAPVTR